MSEFFQFLTLVSSELWDLFLYLKAGQQDELAAQRLAMRVARKVSDEIMLRELPKPDPEDPGGDDVA